MNLTVGIIAVILFLGALISATVSGSKKTNKFTNIVSVINLIYAMCVIYAMYFVNNSNELIKVAVEQVYFKFAILLYLATSILVLYHNSFRKRSYN